MTLARDGALAVGVLVVVAVAGRVTATSVVPAAALAGAAGTVALEVLASTRAATVQRYWRRPRVRVVTVAFAVLVVVATATVAPAVGLNALAGGLLAYVLLVALVATRVVPPTTEWRTE